MVEKTCSTCVRTYKITHADEAWLLASGETFTCPNCGSQRYYTGGNTEQARKRFVELYEERTALRDRLFAEKGVSCSLKETCNRLERSNAALRGVITKLKNKMKGDKKR